jgi:hypothetical protein
MAEHQEPEEAEAELVEMELPGHADDLPPIDFSTFVVSLRTSAMMHLGQCKDQQEGDVNLALARQEIDLLGLFEQKTRGNLTGDEERLLSQVLFDLRTRYIAAHHHRSPG